MGGGGGGGGVGENNEDALVFIVSSQLCSHGCCYRDNPVSSVPTVLQTLLHKHAGFPHHIHSSCHGNKECSQAVNLAPMHFAYGMRHPF